LNPWVPTSHLAANPDGTCANPECACHELAASDRAFKQRLAPILSDDYIRGHNDGYHAGYNDGWDHAQRERLRAENEDLAEMRRLVEGRTR
jgi:hypothetical protein